MLCAQENKAEATPDGEDWSGLANIVIEKPRRAIVRITGLSDIPTKKTTLVKGEMTVEDGLGHWFKKRVLLHLHGGYSTRFNKRSFTVTFCEDEWVGEETTTLQIGDWVPQDGFVFMAFYTDFARGIGEIGYRLYRDLTADRAPVWERAELTSWDTRALHVPDGFPCEVYLNGKYHGVYVWQLRKNRRNFNQKKSVAEHVHLDGNVSDANIFNGTVKWTQFEVRNPKDLYAKTGKVYDGDKPEELISASSAYYNIADDAPEVKEAKKRSAQVRDYVVTMSKYKSELTALESDGAAKALIRSELEKRYDLESLLDYSVFFRVLMNGDGTLKNWQWVTYDGVKWFVFPYDLDQTFGVTLYGYPRPATLTVSDVLTGPFWWVDRYYQEDERERYCQLREADVLTPEAINALAEDWGETVGEDWYAREKERWPLSPCYCPPVCNAGWELYENWAPYANTPDYDKLKAYPRGELVKWQGRLWVTTAAVKGVEPAKRNSGEDSYERLTQWVKDRIAFLDKCFRLADYRTGIDGVGMEEGDHALQREGVYDLMGRTIHGQPRPGVYVKHGALRIQR